MKVSLQKQTPIVEHDLKIGKFTFYSNIIIAEFKEGVYVNFEDAVYAIQVALEIFGTEQPVVYISHRKNSYSMNPASYKEVIDFFPNFAGFAVVTKNKRRRMLAYLERIFIKKPIRVFEEMDDAMLWAKEIIERAS